MSETNTPPAWRTGWTWTLIKCATTIAAAAVAASGVLFWLISKLLEKLPGWLPASWARWAFEWLLSHLWFIGPIVGVFVGLIVSAGIVLVDAKRGKLTKIK